MNTTKEAMTYSNLQPYKNYHRLGYAEQGSTGNVWDIVHVPYNDTTYVLRSESVWGSKGGIGKDVVLYAVTQKGSREIQRNRITHQFDRRLDCLSNWNLQKIRVNIYHQVIDRKSEKKDSSYERRTSTDVCVSMGTKGPMGRVHENIGGCYISGMYERIRYIRLISPGGPYWGPKWEYEIEQKIQLSTSLLEPEFLTEENFQALIKEWNFPELPSPSTPSG